jgi:glycosyltransferase involved in cell wall biosynthesis
VRGSGTQVSIRWATWWPTQYWVDRYNYLAEREDVDFEAVFISEQSSHLDVELDRSSLRFNHVFVNRGKDDAGYYAPRLRLPRPWPIAQGRFDAVVMNYSDTSCLAAALLCSILRKPYFLFVANTKYDEREPSRVKEWVKKLAFGGASGILATGPLQREYALQYAGNAEKVSIIGNPVGSLEPQRYTSPRVRHELRIAFGWRDELVLLFVGRLAREKGLLTLLDALRELYGRGVRPKLVLVGSGPMEEELRARAEELGLKAQFLGFLQGEELAKVYAAADMLVLPSRSETWGLVINEGMEFGLPLILSDRVGSVPVLLEEGENGFSFPAGDSRSLAARIEKLCSDPELRERMGDASRAKSRSNSLEAWGEAVVEAVRASKNGAAHPSSR